MAAWNLGRKMALTDGFVRPCLREVRHYRTYAQFRQAHRSILENRRAVVPWDQRLQRLAESEASWMGFRLDKSARAWDAFCIIVLAPMKEAFWRGWETHARLETLYLARRKAFLEREGQPQPVEIVRMKDLLSPTADVEKMSETERWDTLADYLFGNSESKGRDETFWNMPAPSTMAMPAGEPVPTGPSPVHTRFVDYD